MSGEGRKCYKCGANAIFICKNDKLSICGNEDHMAEHLEEESGMYHHEIGKLADQVSLEPSDSEKDQVMLIDSGLPIQSYTFPVSGMAVHGSSLYVAEKDGVSKFDLNTKSQLWKSFKKSAIWSVAVSNDGSQLGIGLDNGSVHVLNAENGELLQELKPFTNSSTTIVSFISNPTYIVSWSSSGSLYIYNISANNVFVSVNLYNSPILSSAISSNKHIFCGTSTGEIGLYNIQNKTSKSASKVHRSAVTCLVCTNSGVLISAGLDGRIFKWKTDNLDSPQEICNFQYNIIAMTINPVSSEVYFSDSKFSISLLNIETRKVRKTDIIIRDSVTGLVFDTEKKLIYAIIGNRNVAIFEPSLTQIEGTIGNTGLLIARTTLDKKYLVCGFSNGWVKFFNLTTSKVDHEFHYEDGHEIFSQYKELGISIEII